MNNNQISSKSSSSMEFVWVISNFNSVCELLKTVGSPHFCFKSRCKQKWFLRLFNDLEKKPEDKIIGFGLFLDTCKNREKHEVIAEFSMSIMHASETSTIKFGPTNPVLFEDKSRKGHGYTMIPYNSVKDFVDNGGCLRVKCEITIFGETNLLSSLKYITEELIANRIRTESVARLLSISDILEEQLTEFTIGHSKEVMEIDGWKVKYDKNQNIVKDISATIVKKARFV